MDADLLIKVGVIVAILTVLWVLPDWAAYRSRARRIGRALHLVAPAPPRPAGPPIERLAADARRIRDEIRRAPSGIPVARLRGWLEAYDDVLVTACRTLELEQRLGVLPQGPEHDMERERVERMLERNGLPLRLTA
ncbi:MAG TPA: hypothetical protein VNQ53_16515 [Nocardioides sp.]|nr:hypothetical protein [Nocardioides sp.]